MEFKSNINIDGFCEDGEPRCYVALFKENAGMSLYTTIIGGDLLKIYNVNRADSFEKMETDSYIPATITAEVRLKEDRRGYHVIRTLKPASGEDLKKAFNEMLEQLDLPYKDGILRDYLILESICKGSF